MSNGEEASEDEQRLVKEIDKEINKLKYFLEETEELIEIKDYTEMEIVNKQAGNIIRAITNRSKSMIEKLADISILVDFTRY